MWKLVIVAVVLTGLASGQSTAPKSYAFKPGESSEAVLVQKVDPVYTKEARDAGIEGVVLLSFRVDDRGTPRDITLRMRLGHGLDERATEALKQWRFEPATLDGFPTTSFATAEMRFRVDGTASSRLLVGPPPQRSLTLMRSGQTMPVPIRKVDPDYTQQATDARIEGAVTLSIVVNESGIPTDIKVLRPLGYGLDQKAVEAVEQWRFRPGMKDGRPVSVPANVEVNFRLKDKPAEAPQQ